MKNFSQHLEEAKNVHMEHLEDNVLNGGVEGARQAVNFLRSLRDALSGHSSAKVNATVKWDGAPAIFVGKDPRDGKFFVAKKGIFNKNPKVYKTPKEIDADTDGDLSTKLKLALKYLKDIKVDGVLQGDLLFTDTDIKQDVIDGKTFITFHPNTIVYAIPADTLLAKKIKGSKLGVVWHTHYTGTSFENMSASYGFNVKSLGDLDKVWMIDADYEDVSGSALMTKEETAQVDIHLSAAGRTFKKIPAASLNAVSSNDELLTLLKTYHNSKIREGEEISNPTAHAKGLVMWLLDREKTEISKKKTTKGQEQVKQRFAAIKSWATNTPLDKIAAIFELQMHLVHAKRLIIKKMNAAAKLKTFLKTTDGFKITGEEGYVAIDRLSGNAVKLVDRLEFSYANFSKDIVKGWQNDSRR